MTGHKPAHEVELYRDGDAYVVIVELPGFDSEDVDLRWQNGHLHVAAERDGVDDDGKHVVYHRDVGVPKSVRVDDISATFEDDVLEVTLPLQEADERSGTRIDVE